MTKGRDWKRGRAAEAGQMGRGVGGYEEGVGRKGQEGFKQERR